MLAENEELYNRFHLVFEEHYNLLCNYAYSFIGEKNACEDIVQEIFFKIWDKNRELILSDTIRFYLFTAVRNNCLTYLKREKKIDWQHYQNEEMPAELPDIDKKILDDTDYLSLVNKAIALLPLKCREVFLMSRFNNYSYRQIAEALGISVKTVENQIGKALRILRDFVKKQKPFLSIIGMINLIGYLMRIL
ncbi:MAG: RNA polymerase sigma-70 factor [Bacteroidetes bacterium]|nr:RNA polymerase sigma-70 factor [Bacteroidota bacterium]